VLGVVYRSLLVWDPGAPGLPGVGWFVFGLSDTAPQIVFAFVLGLVLYRWDWIVRAGGPRSPALGIGALVLSLSSFVWGRHAGALEFLVLSLGLLVLGSALCVLGRRAGRELAPALVILLFAIPIPGVVLNHVLLPMQLVAASQLEWMLHALGIPAIREGIALQLPHRAISVIETCSGLRGILMLTMLATCWATFFSLRPLASFIMIASAPVIALLVNAIRILSISLTPHSDFSAVHSLQGLAVFAGGIVLLIGVDVALSHTMGWQRRARSTAPTTVILSEGWRRRVLPTALVVLATLVASVALPVHLPQMGARSPVELPATVGEWKLDEKVKVDSLFLGRALVRSHVQRRYEMGHESVTVFVAVDDRLDRSRSVLSPKMGLPGPEWTVDDQGHLPLGPDDLDARWLVARWRVSHVSVLYWYEAVGRLSSEMLRAWLATDRSLFRRPCGALAVRLETESPSSPGGAEPGLVEFAEALRPHLAGLACRRSDEV
jgi:exosortase